MQLVGALLCLVGALRPPTPASPAALNSVLAVVGVVVAASLWFGHAPGRRLHVAAGVYLVATTVLLSQCVTGEGVVATGLAYIWLSVYAAVCFPRRVARVYVVFGMLGLALGMHLAVPLAAGRSAWLVVSLTSIVACEVLAALHDRLRAAAHTDPLTGLLNRSGFVAAARRVLALAERTAAPVTLVLIDLDGFKLVNDRGGHAAGDALLAELAAEWRAGLRRSDVLCRHGGDEFVLLLPGTTPATAEQVVRRLRAGSQAAWSFGIVPVHTEGGLDEALARADRLMYDTKPRGGRRPVPDVALAGG